MIRMLIPIHFNHHLMFWVFELYIIFMALFLNFCKFSLPFELYTTCEHKNAFNATSFENNRINPQCNVLFWLNIYLSLFKCDWLSVMYQALHFVWRDGKIKLLFPTLAPLNTTPLATDVWGLFSYIPNNQFSI
jgi:hypothetical protein